MDTDWNEDSRVSEPRYMEPTRLCEECGRNLDDPNSFHGWCDLCASEEGFKFVDETDNIEQREGDMLDRYARSLSQCSDQRLQLHAYRVGLTKKKAWAKRNASANLQLVSLMLNFEGWVRQDDAWWQEQERLVNVKFWSDVWTAVKKFFSNDSKNPYWRRP